MAYQTGRNVIVNMAPESTFGTLAPASPARRLRINEGAPGGVLTRAPIKSNENRGDGMSTRGGVGTHNVSLSYPTDMSVGSHDFAYEAAFGGTWVAGGSTTQTAGLGAFAVSSEVLTLTPGSPVVLPSTILKVGYIMRWTVGLASADLNRNILIVAMTSTTITLRRTDGVAITNVAGPVSTYTFTIGKSLLNGRVQRSWSSEEHEEDLDSSEILVGCRFGSVGFALTPDNMGIATFGLAGQTIDVATAGSPTVAPYFASPTTYGSLGLTATQAALFKDGTKLLDLTGLQLNFNRRPGGPAVVGSVLMPEIAINQALMDGSQLTALRKDVSHLADFIAGTQFSIFATFEEVETAPADYISLWMTNVIYNSNNKSPIGQDGIRTQTLGLEIGADDRGSVYANTMIGMCTSAAAE